MIYPLSWDNGDITECAFGSVRVVDEKERIYLQIHRKGIAEDGEDSDMYYIENKYLDADTGDEVALPDDIDDIVPTGYNKPLFQIITPNICNNVDLDSPMGISVFANAIDQVKGCDLVYDSYMNEYVLGRKRILVPYSQAKICLLYTSRDLIEFDAMLENEQPNTKIRSKLFISRSRKRIVDLIPEECQDCLLYTSYSNKILRNLSQKMYIIYACMIPALDLISKTAHSVLHLNRPMT